MSERGTQNLGGKERERLSEKGSNGERERERESVFVCEGE